MQSGISSGLMRIAAIACLAVTAAGAPAAFNYLGDRFAGLPAPSNC